MTKSNVPDGDFVKPTTGFWQEVVEPGDAAATTLPPYQFGYPAPLADGSHLILPLRVLPNGQRAVASLIANHASFSVIDTLSDAMADLLRDRGVEQIVGMPTLGLAFAPIVARNLGLSNYVPLGYSRKFWYRDDLAEPVRSITTPGVGKSVYIDPNIDDAVSSGSTLLSVLRLLQRIDCEVVAISVAMIQGVAWRQALADFDAKAPGLVKGAIAGPMFLRTEGGWVPEAGTLHHPDDHSPM